MPIKTIHSFLVTPSKNADAEPEIGGTRVKLSVGGLLLDMLRAIYEGAERECTIDIVFKPTDGAQQNACRDLLVAYADSRQMEDGRTLARRLQGVTTHKSGLGLLFLLTGDEDGETKLVVSRFPADNGILAEQERTNLSVEFLERVFMKKATSYKAALYQDGSLTEGFWFGKVVDKQVDAGSARVSNYWIHDFLASDFRTTSAAGSRRLADALRVATTNAADADVKSALIAAVRLARGLDGKMINIDGFLRQFMLTPEARGLVEQQVPAEHLRKEKFRLSVEELDRHIPLRSIELDNGGVLIAPTASFDDVFKREQVRGREKITTEGRVVNEKLRKGK